MDSFTIELVSNASSELFPDNTLSSFTNFLPDQVNLGGCNFGNFLPFNAPECYRWEISILGRNLLQNDNSLLLGTWAVFFRTRHC